MNNTIFQQYPITPIQTMASTTDIIYKTTGGIGLSVYYLIFGVILALLIYMRWKLVKGDEK